MKIVKKLFNIIKRPEKPKITWWSVVDGLEKVVPILPAKEVIPDWWKRVERFTESMDPLMGKGTVKNCPSFPEFITQGFVVPLWCDLHLQIEHDSFKWNTPHRDFTFDSHGDIQFKDFLPKHVKDNSSMVLKPNCPWRVKTPPGWGLYQLPVFYEFNPVFETMPGIIWTDIHHEINQQMLIKRYGTFTLKRGIPLATYIPYKREKYDYEIQGPNSENAKWSNESFLHVRTKFKGGYKLHQAEVKKCPFGHAPEKTSKKRKKK